MERHHALHRVTRAELSHHNQVTSWHISQAAMTDLAPAPAPAYQRRRLLVASALGVATATIVQFMPEGKDVVALLTALPAGLRSPAMDALVALVAGGFVWHTLELGDHKYDDNKIGLMSEAIPLFPKVVLKGVGSGAGWQGDDATFKVPFSGFVRKWATKITEVKLDRIDDPDHRRELCRALTHCTGVKKALLRTDQVDILEAVASTKQPIPELELRRYNDVTDDALRSLHRYNAGWHRVTRTA